MVSKAFLKAGPGSGTSTMPLAWWGGGSSGDICRIQRPRGGGGDPGSHQDARAVSLCVCSAGLLRMKCLRTLKSAYTLSVRPNEFYLRRCSGKAPSNHRTFQVPEECPAQSTGNNETIAKDRVGRVLSKYKWRRGLCPLSAGPGDPPVMLLTIVQAFSSLCCIPWVTVSQLFCSYCIWWPCGQGPPDHSTPLGL